MPRSRVGTHLRRCSGARGFAGSGHLPSSVGGREAFFSPPLQRYEHDVKFDAMSSLVSQKGEWPQP